MKIFAGSDHGGLKLKDAMIAKLKELGHEVDDVGTYSDESCDYPDYAQLVAKKVLSEPGSFGLLTCGSGLGASMAANRFAGIRAALCHNSLEAKLSRQHNNANVLVMGGRIIGETLASDIIDSFLKSDFEGGRHQKRIEKIENVE